MYLKFIFLFMLFTKINLVNSAIAKQTNQDYSTNQPTSNIISYAFCKNFKITHQDTKICLNGQHHNGGAYYNVPQLNLKCMCVLLQSGIISLNPNSYGITMINTLA